jgi:histidinol-phosphate aminotransferase
VALVPERDDLRALEGYHSAQVDVEVRLNTNESPYPPPEAWRAEYAAAVAAISWERYPDRRALGLRGAIADWHGARRDQVFAANGSNEVLQTLLLAYGGAGRRVVTFEPTYQLHGHIARVTGAEVVEGERGSDFALDEEAAIALIEAREPAITFLCSPNNPTGRVESPGLVRRVLEHAPGLLVVDEAYAQFADWTALDLVDDARPLCVVRTFSKTWSMAAARLGYLVGPTWVVETLEKVILPYHLDAAKQLAGTLALAHVDEMDGRVRQIVAERERVIAGLRRLDIDVFPSGANFVLFRPRRAGGRAVWQALVERSVLVRDCSSWPRLADCLRVTIGTPAENDRFLAALGDSLEALTVAGAGAGLGAGKDAR